MSMTKIAMNKLAACSTLAVLALMLVAPAKADEAPGVQGLVQQRMRTRAVFPDTVQNPGFEAYDPAIATLIGWDGVTHGGDSFRVEADTSQAYVGKKSLVIENVGNPSWGGAIQSIRADRLAGREVELSAWIKTQGVTAPGFHLALKSTQNGGELAYVETDTKIIGNTEWKALKLRTRVPKDATTLVLVLMLDGDGKAWVDEVRLVPLPD